MIFCIQCYFKKLSLKRKQKNNFIPLFRVYTACEENEDRALNKARLVWVIPAKAGMAFLYFTVLGNDNDQNTRTVLSFQK